MWWGVELKLTAAEAEIYVSNRDPYKGSAQYYQSVKLKGDQQTIEGLWYLLKAPTVAISITEGDYLPSLQRIKDCKGEVIYSDDIDGAFCLRSHQNGVIRFNCADSLDRTNAASFGASRLYGAMQTWLVQPLYVASRHTGCFLKPIANMFPISDGGETLLSFKRKAMTWHCAPDVCCDTSSKQVTSQATDVVEVFIYLGEPCHVCQLLLTVAHGSDDSTFPSTVDVRTGRYMDELKLVLEGASIPQCANVYKYFDSIVGTN
ncbi:hypothetical protein HAX54_004954 [Datura stramonium]|uniref:SAC domain-containing protein n=1 Tax=Datura stramonium TaxID=4076 RepID=A0ABS8T944_DATST|nr:hypothetical protein [Datura stramonium]